MSVFGLVNALATLTAKDDVSWWRSSVWAFTIRAGVAGVEECVAGAWSAPVPWAVDTPAEAVEVLATRGLWPWPVGDDAAPRWWCEQCGGSGLDPRVGLYRKPCTERCDWGTAADPPTLAALVAVASLGAPTLLRAEEFARVLVGREPRIVWRVMPREALARWSQVGDGRPVATAPQTIPQAACVARERWQSGDHWNGPSPWWLHDAPDDVAAAWPAVRDLAAIGVTPVALDGDRIVLAVEAL